MHRTLKTSPHQLFWLRSLLLHNSSSLLSLVVPHALRISGRAKTNNFLFLSFLLVLGLVEGVTQCCNNGGGGYAGGSIVEVQSLICIPSGRSCEPCKLQPLVLSLNLHAWSHSGFWHGCIIGGRIVFFHTRPGFGVLMYVFLRSAV